MSVAKYPVMKSSNLGWVDQIPSQWDLKPFFSLFKEQKRSNKGMKSDNLLSLSYGIIKRKEISTLDGLLPASFETYQIVEPDELVFRLTDLQNDKRSLRSALVTERGIITSAYLAVEPQNINPRYASYLFRSYDLSKVFYSMGGGLRQGLNFADLRRLPILYPSAKEQQKIAQFLDYETAKIDALIDEQKRLIELLKEKRQAVISHAVTKGLNPDVPMKDSGVEWLGKVPEHWVIKPLKHIAKLNPSKSEFTDSKSNLCTFIPMEKLKTNQIDVDEVRTISDVYTGYTYFRDGDVICAKVTPCFENRNTAVASGLINGVGFGSSEINVFRPVKVNSRFLFYRLLEDILVNYWTAEMTGAGGLKRVPSSIIDNYLIALPNMAEQQTITDYLDDKTSKIDDLTSEAKINIELLKERRSALISAAVTGKIDVRDWQPPKGSDRVESQLEKVSAHGEA